MAGRHFVAREETTQCRHCQQVFTYTRATGAKKSLCSVTCRKAYQKAHRKPKRFNQAIRTRQCEVCAKDFSYPIGIGSDRRLCSDLCRTQRRHAIKATKPLCVTEGCTNPRGYSDGICNSCFSRRRRTGTLERRVYTYRTLGSHGYIVLAAQHGHALANRHGAVFEHRKVLYDAIGAGPHACHWCNQQVRWVKRGFTRDCLVADHLDGDKTNNDVRNLVPACNRCNSTRGMFMSWVRQHKDDPVLWQMYQQARSGAA